jgi:hypothetical protein
MLLAHSDLYEPRRLMRKLGELTRWGLPLDPTNFRLPLAERSDSRDNKLVGQFTRSRYEAIACEERASSWFLSKYTQPDLDLVNAHISDAQLSAFGIPRVRTLPALSDTRGRCLETMFDRSASWPQVMESARRGVRSTGAV